MTTSNVPLTHELNEALHVGACKAINACPTPEMVIARANLQDRSPAEIFTLADIVNTKNVQLVRWFIAFHWQDKIHDISTDELVAMFVNDVDEVLADVFPYAVIDYSTLSRLTFKETNATREQLLRALKQSEPLCPGYVNTLTYFSHSFRAHLYHVIYSLYTHYYLDHYCAENIWQTGAFKIILQNPTPFLKYWQESPDNPATLDYRPLCDEEDARDFAQVIQMFDEWVHNMHSDMWDEIYKYPDIFLPILRSEPPDCKDLLKATLKYNDRETFDKIIMTHYPQNKTFLPREVYHWALQFRHHDSYDWIRNICFRCKMNHTETTKEERQNGQCPFGMRLVNGADVLDRNVAWKLYDLAHKHGEWSIPVLEFVSKSGFSVYPSMVAEYGTLDALKYALDQGSKLYHYLHPHMMVISGRDSNITKYCYGTFTTDPEQRECQFFWDNSYTRRADLEKKFRHTSADQKPLAYFLHDCYENPDGEAMKSLVFVLGTPEGLDFVESQLFRPDPMSNNAGVWLTFLLACFGSEACYDLFTSHDLLPSDECFDDVNVWPSTVSHLDKVVQAYLPDMPDMESMEKCRQALVLYYVREDNVECLDYLRQDFFTSFFV